MALRAVLDSLDDLDAALYEFYAEDLKTKKFVLAIEGLDTHSTVKGLATAKTDIARKRDEQAARIAELETRLEGLPDDFGGDAYVALKAQADAAGGDPAQVQSLKENYEQRLAAQKAKGETDLAAANARADRSDAALNARVVGDDLAAALVDAGVDKRFLKAARVMLTGAVKVRRDAEAIEAYVETDLGDQTVADFVKAWAQGDGGKAFVTPAEGPSATGGQKGRAPGENPFLPGSWKAEIKAGRVPPEWKDEPAKLRQKDRDARWTVGRQPPCPVVLPHPGMLPTVRCLPKNVAGQAVECEGAVVHLIAQRLADLSAELDGIGAGRRHAPGQPSR